jgi:hypothetical protein
MLDEFFINRGEYTSLEDFRVVCDHEGDLLYFYLVLGLVAFYSIEQG